MIDILFFYLKRQKFFRNILYYVLCHSTYIAIATISLYKAAVIVKTIYDGKQLSLHHFPIFSDGFG